MRWEIPDAICENCSAEGCGALSLKHSRNTISGWTSGMEITKRDADDGRGARLGHETPPRRKLVVQNLGETTDAWASSHHSAHDRSSLVFIVTDPNRLMWRTWTLVYTKSMASRRQTTSPVRSAAPHPFRRETQEAPPSFRSRDTRPHRFLVQLNPRFRDIFFFYQAYRCQPCHNFHKKREGHSAEMQKQENTTVLKKQKKTLSAYSRAG